MRILLTLIFVALGGIVAAQSFPQATSPYVNDFADIIDAQTEARIVEDLKKLREDNDIEMTVVTIKSYADYAGTPQTRRAFTTALFNDWGVGNTEKNNGILMMVALEQREVYIGLGSGYPASYDDRMARVFDQFMKSKFRGGNYSGGIESGVLETIARTSEAWVPAPKGIDGGMILFILGAIGIAFVAFRDRISDKAVGLRRCPTCGQRTLGRSRDRVQNPTIGTKGMEAILTTCRNCDYRDERTRALPVSTSNTRGGFGGGSSSGGGGGGRW